LGIEKIAQLFSRRADCIGKYAGVHRLRQAGEPWGQAKESSYLQQITDKVKKSIFLPPRGLPVGHGKLCVFVKRRFF
jgi:hypothetical protein